MLWDNKKINIWPLSSVPGIEDIPKTFGIYILLYAMLTVGSMEGAGEQEGFRIEAGHQKFNHQRSMVLIHCAYVMKLPQQLLNHRVQRAFGLVNPLKC